MKVLLSFLLFVSLVDADKVLYKTLACPTEELLKNAPAKSTSDSFDLELYTIANSCVVLSREDKVHAIGYDPRNSKSKYQKIVYKEGNVELFILRESLQVEQGGKKNSYRF